MENKEPKQINQISTSDLLKDFFSALTEIEKRLFRTVKELSLCPERVIHGYISDRKSDYTSPFRYLLLAIFLSYLSYTFFYNPEEIGGPFYTTLKGQFKQGIQLRTEMSQLEFRIVEEKFDNFYLEFIRLMSLTYKLIACISIPSLLISFAVFFRKVGFNFPSFIVASVFLGAHVSMVASLLVGPLTLMTNNLIAVSFAMYVPMFFYQSFALARLRSGSRSKNIFIGIVAAGFATLLNISFNVGSGTAISAYVQSYTPHFLEKVEPKK